MPNLDRRVPWMWSCLTMEMWTFGLRCWGKTFFFWKQKVVSNVCSTIRQTHENERTIRIARNLSQEFLPGMWPFWPHLWKEKHKIACKIRWVSPTLHKYPICRCFFTWCWDGSFKWVMTSFQTNPKPSPKRQLVSSREWLFQVYTQQRSRELAPQEPRPEGGCHRLPSAAMQGVAVFG